MLDRPIKFIPYLKSVIWGGEKIAPYKSIETDLHNVGECWEISAVPGHISVVADSQPLAGKSLTDLIDLYGSDFLGTDVVAASGNNFPLLIKIIDACSNLSVQVHPGDELARKRHNAPGKSEAWYIIDCEKGAHIYAGLKSELTPESYLSRLADNTIMEVVGAHSSSRGQFYYVPAGTLHAIGAGNLIAEIQQSSDVTYRVYDYDRRDSSGKPRELHTELAKDAINYTYPTHIVPTGEVYDTTTIEAVKSNNFKIDFLKINEDSTYKVDTGGRTFVVLMVIDGDICIEMSEGTKYSYRQGDTLLVPAVAANFTVTGHATALLVKC